MTIKLALKKILEGNLHTEEEDRHNQETARKNKP
jgi:hypothetical protein